MGGRTSRIVLNASRSRPSLQKPAVEWSCWQVRSAEPSSEAGHKYLAAAGSASACAAVPVAKVQPPW